MSIVTTQGSVMLTLTDNWEISEPEIFFIKYSDNTDIYSITVDTLRQSWTEGGVGKNWSRS